MKLRNYKQFIIKEESLYSSVEKYNIMIDYTLLDDNASEDDIKRLCEKANKYGVKSVCVMPKHVKVAALSLKESKVLVCTVISFPEGTNKPDEKLSETRKAIIDGADEVDTVMNYPKLKELFSSGGDKNWNEELNFLVNEDIKPLVDECHANKNKDGENVILKVIVESGLLTDYETEESTDICIKAGADFIKTSTGKVDKGAEINKVQIMYDEIKELGSKMKIKASGGIRTMSDIENFGRFVDRFGMGYGSVDVLNGESEGSNSEY